MIVVTGASGRTGGAAARALLAKGEKIRVVGRDAYKLKPLVDQGAEPFVGNVEDAASMTKAFEGADAVYLVVPEDPAQEDLLVHQELASTAFAAAVAAAHVPYVVALSSIGAQQAEKTGPIVSLHNFEQKLNHIPGLNVLYLRAAYFMENLLISIPTLRSMGMLPGGLNGDSPMPWIATKDIGAYAAKRLAARDFTGSTIQELHGERDISMKQAATVVGNAIGKPKLNYMQVPFMMLEPALVQIGLPKKTAALLIEMWKGANAGLINPLEPRTAENTTPTTLESFVTEVFVPAYQKAAA
ncbi:MAG TPA: NmrA family NAD(P)-binding protein [Candidatus Acidoferrales bacterium]